MDQNEINNALHAQLKEAAQRIFTGLEIEPGNYSAGEVEKVYSITKKITEAWRKSESKTDFEAKRSEVFSALYKTGFPDEIITISCNTFRASMPAVMVFAKLAAWEREFKISTKDRAKFVKEKEGENIFTCVVNFPKSVKNAAGYVSKDDLRPIFTGVCMDPEGGYIAASDTHVLTKMMVDITDIQGAPKGVIIDPKVIKAVAGQICTVKLSQFEETKEQITITTEKGDIFTCENIKGNFPAVDRVIPSVNRNGLFQLSKESISAVTAFAKGVAKAKKSHPVITIELAAFSNSGTMKFYNPETESTKECKFNVVGSPRVNVVFGIDANKLVILSNNWDGTIWYLSPARPFIFGTDADVINIGMPMAVNEPTITPDEVKGIVPAADRANYDLALAKIEAKQNKVKAVSLTISKEEKEESAKRYSQIKGYNFVELTEKDEIIMITPNGATARYVGTFRRSGDMVLFDCEKHYITFPEINERTIYNEYREQEVNELYNLELLKEVTEILSEIVELSNKFGCVVEMIRMAGEIEELAQSIGIAAETTTPAKDITEVANDTDEPVKNSSGDTLLITIKEPCRQYAGRVGTSKDSVKVVILNPYEVTKETPTNGGDRGCKIIADNAPDTDRADFPGFHGDDIASGLDPP